MGLQLFEKKYMIGEVVTCIGCLSKKHKASASDNGLFVCLDCGFGNEYDLDSFSETNVESVLRNAYKMAGHRRRDGKISV